MPLHPLSRHVLRRPRLPVTRCPAALDALAAAARWRALRRLAAVLGLGAVTVLALSSLGVAYGRYRRAAAEEARLARNARTALLLQKVDRHRKAPLRSMARVPGTRLFLNPKYHLQDPEAALHRPRGSPWAALWPALLYCVCLVAPAAVLLAPHAQSWYARRQKSAAPLPPQAAPSPTPPTPNPHTTAAELWGRRRLSHPATQRLIQPVVAAQQPIRPPRRGDRFSALVTGCVRRAAPPDSGPTERVVAVRRRPASPEAVEVPQSWCCRL
eukprot:EG_transcript_11401